MSISIQRIHENESHLFVNDETVAVNHPYPHFHCTRCGRRQRIEADFSSRAGHDAFDAAAKTFIEEHRDCAKVGGE